MNAGGSVWARAVDIVVGRRWWTKNFGEGKALRWRSWELWLGGDEIETIKCSVMLLMF